MNRLKQTGFTLIELAIVLMIVGVLAGGVISTLGARIENSKRLETKKDLETIKQALLGYAYTNKFLPCADDPADTDADGDSDGDGRSDETGAACDLADVSGSLPWVTLGVGGNDAWGNRYGYWVDSDFASTGGIFTMASDAGGIVATRTIDGTGHANVTADAVAVIFSRGKNGYGAVGSDYRFKAAVPASGHDDELENADPNNGFITRTPTPEGATTGGGAFDDIVIWISEYELKAKMVEAGALP